MINVNLDSEIGELKKVILSYANPWLFGRKEIKSIFEPNVFFQFIRNRVRPYEYKIAREEQQVLIDLLQKENVEVLIAENNIGISQHYTRDIGFAIDNLFIISKMGSQYRKDEPDGIKKFTNHFSKAFKITNGSIEGGDVLLYKDKVIVGLGEATNLAGLNNLKRILNENQNKREIVPISFNQREVIHLDTKFNIIGENLAIFYPQCFEKNSLKWFENHFEFKKAVSDVTLL